MKIQYLAVIFVVIMVPISLALSTYIQTQVDTIALQTSYKSKLYDATYDAVTAFQINTVNNKYSSISNSKIRDIEASANTFFTSLADTMNATGYSKEMLQPFVPALVYTLYDGYYLYGKYKNVLPSQGAVQEYNDSQYQWGLKPYVYYSCRYVKGSEEVIVNYTLDNFITVYYRKGLGNNNQYETKSGYLINPKAWDGDNSKYDDIDIKDTVLTEELLFSTKDNNDNYEHGTYEYINYQSQKIYKESNLDLANKYGKYFRYENYKKTYISHNTQTERDIENYINQELRQYGAHKYFDEAKVFSEWLNKTLDWVTQEYAVDENGNKIDYEELQGSTGNEKIFDTTKNTNNPFSSNSIFDENRRVTIKHTIQTTLSAAIGSYNEYSGVTYEFALPVLEESDWDKIQNHICVLSFLQGLPIGSKYYNDYVILTNDKNEEYIAKDAIYITTQEEGSSNIEYHQPGCNRLIENKDTSSMTIIPQTQFKEAYYNLNFLRQTVRISEGNYIYFYPQAKYNPILKKNNTCTACYNCIVNSSSTYDIEDIIDGIITDPKVENGEPIFDASDSNTKNNKFKKVRSMYYSALARERYYLYKSNDYLNENEDENEN